MWKYFVLSTFFFSVLSTTRKNGKTVLARNLIFTGALSSLKIPSSNPPLLNKGIREDMGCHYATKGTSKASFILWNLYEVFGWCVYNIFYWYECPTDKSIARQRICINRCFSNSLSLLMIIIVSFIHGSSSPIHWHNALDKG